MKNVADVFTLEEAAREVGRSRIWFWHGIRSGKIEAFKLGRQWTITGAEIRRIKANPITITRQDVAGHSRQ